MLRLRSVFGPLFLLAVVVLAGCDAARVADVKGTVQFEGKPIEEGAITFYPSDGKGPSSGGDIKNGQFSVRVPIGLQKVTVSWPKAFGPKKKLYENDPNSPEIAMKRESIPTKYSDQAETELTLDVQRGTNEKHWDLKK